MNNILGITRRAFLFVQELAADIKAMETATDYKEKASVKTVFTNLPPEVHLLVISHVDIYGYQNLRSTNRYFHRLVITNKIKERVIDVTKQQYPELISRKYHLLCHICLRFRRSNVRRLTGWDDQGHVVETAENMCDDCSSSKKKEELLEAFYCRIGAAKGEVLGSDKVQSTPLEDDEGRDDEGKDDEGKDDEGKDDEGKDDR
jgi:hypothetical protein